MGLRLQELEPNLKADHPPKRLPTFVTATRAAWLGEDADGQDALSDALDTMHLQPPYCNYLGEDYAAPRTTPAEREDSKKTCDASNAEL